MFRCTECDTVFDIKPDYCDCGNDQFVDLSEGVQQEQVSQMQYQTPQQQYNQEETIQPPPVVSKPKKATNVKDLVSKIIFVLCIVLSVFAWVFIGKDAAKVPKAIDSSNPEVQEVAVNIPNIDEVWDSTPPKAQKHIGKKKRPKNKAILNSRMSTFDKEMRTYIITLGQIFVKNWARGSVVGDGACEVEFRINKDGKVIDKKILKASNNSTMDDSVKIMLENITQINPPPASYRGERIIIAFSIKNRAFKVFYPHY